LTLAIGNLAISLTRSTNTPDHYSHFTVHEKHVYTLKIRDVLKSNAFSDRYTAHVIAVDSLPVSGKILLYITKATAIGPYEVDDEIITFSSLTPIRPLLNPHQFDYKKYLSHMGIAHQAHLGMSRYLLRESPNTTLYGIAAKTRVHIIKRLKQEAFGEEELGIIQALLLGQRNE